MYKEVILSNGRKTIVDEKNYFQVIYNGPWHYKATGKGYAFHWKGKGKNRKAEYLHHFIRDLVGFVGKVDHRDLDGLNNTEENLRPATKSQNAMNSKLYSNNSSGVRGVHEDKKAKKFRAYIRKNGKLKWLGSFDTKEEAAEVRRKATEEEFGEYGRL
jgi:hypothetical protein